MNSQIIITDDFYDIPYQYHKSFEEKHCLITDETIGKISQILGNSIKIVSASNEIGNTSGVLAHLECDWIAVIYLTLPLEAFGEFGLKFYSHIETGLEAFPTQEEMNKYQINENELGRIFNSDLSLWKEYANISIKYNRMVLFRGNKWHSYDNELNNSMCYQKIIIKNI
jgi:hypothetical protein